MLLLLVAIVGSIVESFGITWAVLDEFVEVAVPKKIRVFLWTDLHGRTLTNGEMFRRGLSSRVVCHVCN